VCVFFFGHADAGRASDVPDDSLVDHLELGDAASEIDPSDHLDLDDAADSSITPERYVVECLSRGHVLPSDFTPLLSLVFSQYEFTVDEATLRIFEENPVPGRPLHCFDPTVMQQLLDWFVKHSQEEPFFALAKILHYVVPFIKFWLYVDAKIFYSCIIRNAGRIHSEASKSANSDAALAVLREMLPDLTITPDNIVFSAFCDCPVPELTVILGDDTRFGDLLPFEGDLAGAYDERVRNLNLHLTEDELYDLESICRRCAERTKTGFVRASKWRGLFVISSKWRDLSDVCKRCIGSRGIDFKNFSCLMAQTADAISKTRERLEQCGSWLGWAPELSGDPRVDDATAAARSDIGKPPVAATRSDIGKSPIAAARSRQKTTRAPIDVRLTLALESPVLENLPSYRFFDKWHFEEFLSVNPIRRKLMDILEAELVKPSVQQKEKKEQEPYNGYRFKLAMNLLALPLETVQTLLLLKECWHMRQRAFPGLMSALLQYSTYERTSVKLDDVFLSIVGEISPPLEAIFCTWQIRDALEKYDENQKMFSGMTCEVEPIYNERWITGNCRTNMLRCLIIGTLTNRHGTY
jgi:hypothetical protein